MGTTIFHFSAVLELHLLFTLNTVLFLVMSYLVRIAHFIMDKTSNVNSCSEVT